MIRNSIAISMAGNEFINITVPDGLYSNIYVKLNNSGNNVASMRLSMYRKIILFTLPKEINLIFDKHSILYYLNHFYSE